MSPTMPRIPAAATRGTWVAIANPLLSDDEGEVSAPVVAVWVHFVSS
jgi:hypothetical protein